MISWKPSSGMKIIRDTYVSELVHFVPAVTIDCNPPYIKGQQDSTWVNYPRCNRPKTQEDWETTVGMSLITMI